MAHIKKLTFNLFEENTYVIWGDSTSCAVVDPGCDKPREKEELRGFLKAEGLVPESILLTHAHPDHIGGIRELCDSFGCRVLMDQRERISLEFTGKTLGNLGFNAVESFDFEAVGDGQEFSFGNLAVTALSTPGHSAGGLCWYFPEEKLIFTGDTLFKGCIGRTDLPGGCLDLLLESIRGKLMSLDGDIEIYPGHGPSSSIAYERQTNPFIYGGDCPDEGFFPQEENDG